MLEESAVQGRLLCVRWDRGVRCGTAQAGEQETGKEGYLGLCLCRATLFARTQERSTVSCSIRRERESDGVCGVCVCGEGGMLEGSGTRSIDEAG
jgi:hypothetical protein